MKDSRVLDHVIEMITAIQEELAPFSDSGMTANEVRHQITRLANMITILSDWHKGPKKTENES
jgi:hypothetical protein